MIKGILKNIHLVIILTLTVTAPSFAEQIIPVPVRNLGFTGVLEHNTVSIPFGAYEIAGWSGFVTLPFGSRPNYIAIVFWHEAQGGTPHELEIVYLSPEFQTLTPRMFPAGDGHTVAAGDRVYANFYCGPGGVCGAGATFYFRVR